MPFVVDFDGERIFDGYTVAAHLRAGWERHGSVHVFFEADWTTSPITESGRGFGHNDLFYPSPPADGGLVKNCGPFPVLLL
jgi:hypothetical protein